MFEGDVYGGLRASPGPWKPEKKYIGIFPSLKLKM
jgi:hypothetical protein